MDDIRFVSKRQALQIHRRQLERFGGRDGLRDEGLLESALAVPMAKFADQYAHEDLAAMAGAYLFHLARNHPCIDGNKRVALGVMLFFLQINGFRCTADHDRLYDAVIGVASGQLDKTQTAEFIRNNMAPI